MVMSLPHGPSTFPVLEPLLQASFQELKWKEPRGQTDMMATVQGSGSIGLSVDSTLSLRQDEVSQLGGDSDGLW